MTGKADADGATGTEKFGNAAVDLEKAGADAEKVVDALSKTDSESVPVTK